MRKNDVQPLEALKRMKLLMSYDTSKTLTENEKKQKRLIESQQKRKMMINEGPLALIGLPWLIGGGATGIAGISTWIYNVSGGGSCFANLDGMLKGCSANFSDLKPSDDVDHDAAAEAIYTAIDGWGTDEDAVKAAFASMKTPADICELNRVFAFKYGDLYDWIDGDFDGSSVCTYVWGPISSIVLKAKKDLEKAKEEEEKKKKEEEEKKDEPKKDEPKKDEPKKTTPTKTAKVWKQCSGTYTRDCQADKIKEVQACLGLSADGKWGPITDKKLKSLGYSSFVDADVDKICKKDNEFDTKDVSQGSDDDEFATTGGNPVATTTDDDE